MALEAIVGMAAYLILLAGVGALVGSMLATPALIVASMLTGLCALYRGLRKRVSQRSDWPLGLWAMVGTSIIVGAWVGHICFHPESISSGLIKTYLIR